MKLRGGHTTQDRRLDRLPSKTTEHLDQFPLTRANLRAVGVQPTGCVIGVNWYAAFDSPVKGRDGRWRVAANGQLGAVRGGHSVYLPAKTFDDASGWWEFYNQGTEGRCVQFATSRMMSHFNRKRYSVAENDIGRWLYWEAQKSDEWEGGSYPGATPHYEGTSVRAALEVVRALGIIVIRRGVPNVAEGISAYRWASTIEDVLAGLGRTGASEIPLLNSWGRSYPRVVYIPVSVHARLLAENGEYGFTTDR